MNTRPDLHPQQRRRLHVLHVLHALITSAIAVIVVCSIGAAAMAGFATASITPAAVIDTRSSDPLSGLKVTAQAERRLAAGEQMRATDSR